ncbi:MAG: nucleotidyltransferase family protein [Candidatus Omnitrophica bacterium]|nr:nucleotidyltransferase family protein [Candidatus Omnitrophota bacterium]
MRLSPLKQDLLTLLNGRYGRISSACLNWKKLLSVAEYSKVETLLFNQIKDLDEIAVPEDIRRRLKKSCQINTLRNIFIMDEFDRVCSSLGSANVDLILLKGAYFARTIYRHVAGTRKMSDIDILVREEDVERAHGILESLGYRHPGKNGSPSIMGGQGGRKAEMYFNGQKDTFLAAPVHLHWHIVNLSAPFFKMNWTGIEMREIWEGSAPFGGTAGANVRVMDPEHMVLALASHGLSHGFSRIDLLYDIHSYIAHYRDAISWEALAGTARRWGLTVPLYTGLLLAKSAFYTDIPSGFFKSLRPGGPSLLERYMIRYISNHDFPGEGKCVLLYLAMNRTLLSKAHFMLTGLRSLAFKADN